MGYTNDENRVINFSEMNAAQEQEFIENYERFGSTDRAENESMLSEEDFAPEIKAPSQERVIQNIDDADEFEEADEETKEAARSAYRRGWASMKGGRINERLD